MISVTKANILFLLLQKNNGFLKTSDVVGAGVSKSTLSDFARRYGLERVAHGLYMSQDAWPDGLYVIQTRYPEAVFSHETALYLLGLANREPKPLSLTLKAGKSSTTLAKEGVKVYKVKDDLFDIGLTEARSPSGNTVRTYNAERTICDLFRSRRSIEIQELKDAVKTYVSLKDKNIPLLMRYTKAFSVEKSVRQYLEVLL